MQLHLDSTFNLTLGIILYDIKYKEWEFLLGKTLKTVKILHTEHHNMFEIHKIYFTFCCFHRVSSTFDLSGNVQTLCLLCPLKTLYNYTTICPEAEKKPCTPQS